MTVSQRINLYLKANDVSVDTLSGMTGISTKRLNSILTNGKPMRGNEFIKIITALKVEPNTFLKARKLDDKSFEESDPTFNKLMANILALSERNLRYLLVFSNGLLKNGYQKESRKESIDKMEVAL